MNHKTLADWQHYLTQLNPNVIDLGLGRVSCAALACLIEKPAPVCITVAGTNGKGSTISFMESILANAGLSVASYTSPHLNSFNERIKFDGIAISDDLLINALAWVESKTKAMALTYFEMTTLAAFWAIQQQIVDVALLEVGLGGRLDAVNIIDADIAILTKVAIDHEAFLGSDREQIGFEKAGILRKNQVFICGDREMPMSVLKASKKLDCQFHQIDHHFHCQADFFQLGDTRIVFDKGVTMPEYQYDNLGVALTALCAIPSVALDSNMVNKTIQQGQPYGRQTWLTIQNKNILLDVAHNLDAVECLKNRLLNSEINQNRKIIAVFGLLQDKPLADIILIMDELVDHWCVSPLQIDRSYDILALQGAFSKQSKHIFTHAVDSFNQAWLSANQHDIILIFGSFYLINELQTALTTLISGTVNK